QVFVSVTSVLNMSVFKDRFALEDLVEDMKKQNADLSFGPLQSNGQVAVQGSFPAFQVLTDFLLRKARALLERDSAEEGKSPGRLRRRRLQEHGSTTGTRNSARGAQGEEQVVVLDTGVYQYMKHFLPRLLQGKDGVVISDVTDGDVTTVCVRDAGGARAGQVLSVKKDIEDWCVKLHSSLCKERISFKEHSRDEKQRYRRACERLRARYPRVLVVPCDTHIELIGLSAEVSKFTKEV
ncbi:RBM43 protein, partial [Scytalopus superciliaris]|nr:RBM43 protein [Scytalopus superciliaris]